MTSDGSDHERPDRRRLRVPAHLAGARLDRFLAEHFPAWSRNQIRSAIQAGDVRVNDRRGRAGQSVAAGDTLEIPVWAKYFAARAQQDAPRAPRRGTPELAIVHEDEHLLVVNKPADMAVHGGAGDVGRLTVMEALRERILAGFGLVHRLDRDTTGLLVLVRGDDARRNIMEAFAGGDGIEKTYEAVVSGAPDADEGVVDAPLRAPGHRARGSKGRAEVDTGRRGRAASTSWQVLERFTRAARLRVTPHTGRTHQIRAHLRHMGHALLVDPLYGMRGALRLRDPRNGRDHHLRRTPLHAAQLALHHPIEGTPMRFEAPLPDDFRQLLELLRVITGRGLKRGGLPPPYAGPLPGERAGGDEVEED